MSDPYVNSDEYAGYDDPVEQLHDMQEVAEETAADNADAEDAGAIFNEVSNDFYGF